MRGSTVLTVTKGAYENTFKKQGFFVVPSNPRNKPQATPNEPVGVEKVAEEHKEETPKAASKKNDSTEEDEGEPPLSSLSNKELKEYAKKHGIDISDCKDRESGLNKILESQRNKKG